MKPSHERNQECLPPKKRDLPQSNPESEELGRNASCSGNNTPASDNGDWPRSVVLTGQSQPGVRYSIGCDNVEGITGVTVDQYGMVYKVALPSANYSPTSLHPVVSMSQLSSAYNVASPLIQHAGIPYPPIHYAQIPHTSLQFLSSPYAVPYAVPPGFLTSQLISPSGGISASHVPHLVPFPSIISEGVTSPPQTSSPAFAKVLSTTLPVASPPDGALQVEVARGRVPVYYHSSGLNPAYTSVAVAGQSPEILVENRQVPQVVREKENVCVSSPGEEEEQLDQNSVSEPKEITNSCAVGCKTGNHVTVSRVKDKPDDVSLSFCALSKNEVVSSVHRNTPDTDLEVQQVVGGLASQDHYVTLSSRKGDLSPLNLSQNAKIQNQLKNPSIPADHRTPVTLSSTEDISRTVYSQKQDEHRNQMYKDLHKATVLASGQSVLIPVNAERALIKTSVESVTDAGSLDTQTKVCVEKLMDPIVESSPIPRQDHSVRSHQPTSLPSHFMKGAIIQLATGELKRVEDLQTHDFVRSAEITGSLKIDSSTLVDVKESSRSGYVSLHFIVGEQQSKVNIDVPPEHPFFVYGQGWSSCNPLRTAQIFGLSCHQLQVGDVCISLSLQAPGGNSSGQTACQPIDLAASLRERTAEIEGDCGSSVLTLQAERSTNDNDELLRDGTTRNTRTPPPSREGSSATSFQQRWSAPGFQRYSLLNENPSSPSLRPLFIPQEVKLSIEGRSNAGK
ncbi:ataxin-1-like [Protopterus annectens]|uniref:ataxin-1-like n=1 Tax=Protopterus annectens TaxID=7888 RepID=UPI001CFA5138|nr:ataxin-1-like [Protopterus annectens]XP_043925877.1 ataxin-1-like [Protopterus annectens]XP_043925884.1 ataxin-1-like [Protopterus annectens]